MLTFSFEAPLWRYAGQAAWFFITVPEGLSDEIADAVPDTGRGFGAVRVEVTVGGTTWRTSVFPDSKAGAYVLPVKKQVRVAECLVDGGSVPVELTVLATS